MEKPVTDLKMDYNKAPTVAQPAKPVEKIKFNKKYASSMLGFLRIVIIVI
jgi:hypothetical protein